MRALCGGVAQWTLKASQMPAGRRKTWIGGGCGSRQREASAVAKSPEQSVSNREVAAFKSCHPHKEPFAETMRKRLRKRRFGFLPDAPGRTRTVTPCGTGF